MKNITLISIAVSLACTSYAVNARKPHPVSPYDIGNVTCTCDWSVAPSSCTVSWSDVNAPGYGVDVEFEAEWMEGDVEMKSFAELDLDDNWMCDEFGACSASGEFVLPDFPADADIKFVGKVKGFDTGSDGVTSRDFVKATGACNLPANG
ncbi:MAG: hypothetical protein JSU75_04275 [Gammaproteobacteria bacterium]|nr:MAG: hypothetical protein JSU75_04275 [Gammaproteobacteria bacterium]